VKSKNVGFAVLGGALLAAAAPARAFADVVVFNFESVTSTTSGGALTILTFTQGGLTLTLTRPGSSFDITDLSTFGAPASYGSRTLDPFKNAGSNTPFLLNFSQAVSAVSIGMGDFGADADALSLQLFSGLNGTGSLLNSATGALPGLGFDFTGATLSASAAGANSALFIGGSTNSPNSVYYDNITVSFTPVNTTPEPGTILLLATGLAGLGFVKRTMRPRS
jgi:hypothetical protein